MKDRLIAFLRYLVFRDRSRYRAGEARKQMIYQRVLSAYRRDEGSHAATAGEAGSADG